MNLVKDMIELCKSRSRVASEVDPDHAPLVGSERREVAQRLC